MKVSFFDIYKAFLNKLKVSKDKKECLSLLDSITWRFGSRDHSMLSEFDVFKTLRFGNGHRNNLLKKSWGHKLQTTVRDADDANDDLSAEVLSRFEYLFYGVISRIVEGDNGVSLNI